MIDLDRIESRCKEASRNGYGKHPVIECASAESIMELTTRLRQAEKDAARYRELRDAESETCLEFINAKARAASPEWLDGLVDEYMKCSN